MVVLTAGGSCLGDNAKRVITLFPKYTDVNSQSQSYYYDVLVILVIQQLLGNLEIGLKM